MATRVCTFPSSTPDLNNGVVLDSDGDRSAGFLGSTSIGRLRINGAFVDRAKHIPTASFPSVFGDGRERTEDRRAYVDATYSGLFGKRWSGLARVGADYSTYAGTYPYDCGIDVSSCRTMVRLTIGETTAFLREGGIVRIFRSDNRLRLQINNKSAEAAGLKISSPLLQLADQTS